MQRRSVLLTTLRRRDMGVALALFVMVLQLIFSTAHLSALSVAAAVGGPTGARLGFLQICTAEGLARIPAHLADEGDTGRSGYSGDSCLLCGSAAVDGAQQIAVVPVAALPDLPLVGSDLKPMTAAELRAPGFRRAGTLRGPPLV